MRWFVALTVFLIACGSSQSPNQQTTDADTLPPIDGTGSGSSTVDELRFAIVGDTRPPSPNDTANYPTAIITKIFQDIEAVTPHLPFAISTGDYMFADTYKSEQLPQLQKYLAARAGYTGVLYPTMGNHECTGATDSNCGTGAKDGVTKNMTDFIAELLTPIGIASPYYTEQVSATDGSWTAKFVFVACNAWSTTQAAWLTQQLSQATTYTFVVRHEGTNALSTAPCSASQPIIDAHPLTLMIVGHTHAYAHYLDTKEVVVGIGGAPLTSGTNYGYVIVERNANGNLTATAYDYMTNAVIDTFHVQPSGAAA
jgi:hypothetical protein